jgi:hypothetical protein
LAHTRQSRPDSGHAEMSATAAGRGTPPSASSGNSAPCNTHIIQSTPDSHTIQCRPDYKAVKARQSRPDSGTYKRVKGQILIHLTQSRPDFDLGSEVNFRKRLRDVPSSLSSGTGFAFPTSTARQ